MEILDDIEKNKFLKFLSSKFSKNLDIIEYGINGISFTLLPTKKISISLETIFKTFNTSTTIPLVKYNPEKIQKTYIDCILVIIFPMMVIKYQVYILNIIMIKKIIQK